MCCRVSGQMAPDNKSLGRVRLSGIHRNRGGCRRSGLVSIIDANACCRSSPRIEPTAVSRASRFRAAQLSEEEDQPLA